MAKRKGAPKKRKSPRAPREDQLEQCVEDFSEEMECLGKRFSERMERKGRDARCCFRDTFGVVGPLLSSVLGLVLLALLMWVLSIVNVPVGSGLLSNIHYFLLAHIAWFFLIMMFFSYASYVSRRMGQAYRLVSPVVSAAGITVALWIVGSAIRVANISLGVEALNSLASFITGNLWLFFYLFSLLGYLVVLACFVFGKCGKAGGSVHERPPPEKHWRRRPVPGRLYRSGRERILGGVCGGIAEHLGVDPVLIRLLWVAMCIAWGFGIVLYVICWIIIPRNPRDKWR